MKRLIILLFVGFVSTSISTHVLGAENGSAAYLSFLKGYRAAQEGRYQQAIENYKAALNSDPNSSTIRSELALLYTGMGELPKAEEQLKEALRIDPNNCTTLKLLAGLLSSRGESDKAKELYERCISVDPEDTDAYIYLGSIYIAQKDYERALATYQCSARASRGPK